MVGVAILAAGFAGLVIPALPGWVLIFVGLGVLATEFAWAERLLDSARERVKQAAELALDPRRRRRNQIIAVVGVVVFAVVAFLYVETYGFGLPN